MKAWHRLVAGCILALAPAARAGDPDPAAGRAEAARWIEILKKDASKKKEAAAALGQIGAPAGAAIPVLASLAGDRDDAVRGNAVWALGKIAGPRYEPVGPPLTAETIAKYYPSTEDTKANAEPLAKVALPVLKRAMGDKAADVRVNAAFALGCMEEKAIDAAPLLARALTDDKDRRVCRNAAWALTKVQGALKAVLPALKATAASNDEFLRHAACTALSWYGPEGAPALPEVLKALDKEKGGKYTRKVDYLGVIAGMEEAAASAVPSVAAILDSTVEVDQSSAAYCLGRIRVGVLPFVPRFIQLLASPDMFVRWNVAWALGRLGPDAKAASPELRRLADQDPEPAVKANALQALSIISGVAVPTGSEVPEPTGSGSGGARVVSSADTVQVVK